MSPIPFEVPPSDWKLWDNKYVAQIKRKFQPNEEMCHILIELKTSNAAYQKVINKLITHHFSQLPPNGIFLDGYSPEYELGYRGGLSIFLFPEAELERLRERKNFLTGEEEENG
jgi:hypothetical protein